MPKPVFKPNRFNAPTRVPRLGTIPEESSAVTADVLAPSVATSLKSTTAFTEESRAPDKLSNLTWTASEPKSDLSDAWSIQKSERELKLYVTEMESKMDQLHTIIQTTDREKVELLNQLEEEKRKVKDLQFRVDEESIAKQNLEYVTEMESKMDQLHTIIKTTDREKELLYHQLEVEKRKVEELQFHVDEELIIKWDLEMQTKLQNARIEELEESLLLEKTKVDKLQRALEDTRYVTEMESKMDQLHTMTQTTDRDKEPLYQLEVEKRKVKDLQFRADEVSITKLDLKSLICVAESNWKEIELIRRVLKAEKDTLVQEAEALETGKESLHSMTLEIESCIVSVCEEFKAAKEIMCEKENLERKYRELKGASETLAADKEKLIAELYYANRELLEIGLDYEELVSKQNELNVKVTNLLQEKDKLTEEIAVVRSQHDYSEKDKEELQLAQERIMMIHGEIKLKIKKKAINLKQVLKMLNKV